MPFEILYALAEVLGGFEGEANEGVRFLKSLIDVGPVFGVANINMRQKTFGY